MENPLAAESNSLDTRPLLQFLDGSSPAVDAEAQCLVNAHPALGAPCPQSAQFSWRALAVRVCLAALALAYAGVSVGAMVLGMFLLQSPYSLFNPFKWIFMVAALVSPFAALLSCALALFAPIPVHPKREGVTPTPHFLKGYFQAVVKPLWVSLLSLINTLIMWGVWAFALQYLAVLMIERNMY